MTHENSLANARRELAIAADALRVARAALELGIVRDALSRAYYAVFHGVRALLLLDGLEPKTHSGVGRLFSDQWVRVGRVPSSWMLVFTRLQAYRSASDYSYAFDIELGAGAAEVEAAAELLAAMTAIVERATGKE